MVVIMKFSDYVALFLVQRGVKCVFGYQGGSVTHLIDSINNNPAIEYVQNYHEQASAFCADAYARLSYERIGVAIASNGPGATNLITGIANAYCDSVPALFITGQVHTFAMKRKEAIRQESFQEIDILSAVSKITKYRTTIMNPLDVRYVFEKACFIAQTGRPGPVLIDIPVDIQGMDINIENLRGFTENDSIKPDISRSISTILKKIKMSKRPILLLGGGTSSSKFKNGISKMASILNMPVVASLQGLDSVDHSENYFCGFIGTYGNRSSNIAIQNADLVLALGTRLDMRQTGKAKEMFAKYAEIIHVDVDIEELNHTVKESLSIHCDINYFLETFNKELYNQKLPSWNAWLQLVKQWEKRFQNYLPDNKKIQPDKIIRFIGKILSDEIAVTSDVGQNQMWVAQYFRCKSKKLRIINSGGLGSMGYSIPAAIAAYYTKKYKHIIGFTGDGGIQMNIQELCLIGSKSLPVKIVILNNYSLGLIREMHERYYENRCIGSIIGFSQPDFKILAQAYNIRYMEIKTEEDMINLHTAIYSDEPVLINCILSQYTSVEPCLLGNECLDDQWPYLLNHEKELIIKELSELEKESCYE